MVWTSASTSEIWVRGCESLGLGKLRRLIPGPTGRLRFREMSDADLDPMADLLGDAEAMRYYPRPKTRDEALGWIRWNERNYADHSSVTVD